MKDIAPRLIGTLLGTRPPAPLARLRGEIEEKYRAKAAPKKLLLADDDPLAIEQFEAATAAWNYTLIATGSARETQALLERGDALAGAVLDALFMNGSGVGVYAWIARNRAELKVAFLTNYPGEKIQDLVRGIGPAIVLAKDMLADASVVAKLMLIFGIERRSG